jgi:PAS domain S-box-containing protein
MIVDHLYVSPWLEASNYPSDVHTASQLAQYSHEAFVITEATAPFCIIAINRSWNFLCEYSCEEVLGRTFRFMQGAETDTLVLQQLCDGIQAGRAIQTYITNYKKSGCKFYNHLRVRPLYSGPDQALTHYLGILREILPVDS